VEPAALLSLPAVAEPATAIRVLIVEDEVEVSRALAKRLTVEGFATEIADDARTVIGHLDGGTADWDVVLLDVGLPEVSGLELLHLFREAGALSSVIMLTGDTSANTAAACMRAGAFHYLTKPFRPFELSTMVQSAARYTTMRRQLAGVRHILTESAAPLLVGSSAAMRRVRAALERLALQSVSILIQGESGTGKELVARELHERGPRRTGPFVALNCGAIPEQLIDSELFGHSKGAFTGATSDRPGVFVEADGGTLFLDEIGDMPLGVQSRLLRVLQEGEVRPVGGSGVRQVDVRVVAATHVDLQHAVERQRFRQDLFYRLNVVVLEVPALRERLDDLPLLAAHFLRKHGGASPPGLSPDALEAMADYPWPGNVRELENAVMHAIALHHGEVIGPESLPHQIASRVAHGAGSMSMRVIHDDDAELLPLTEAKRKASTQFERRYLLKVMERAKGSVSEAARQAGLDRANFRRLLQRHGLDAATFK
jgi:two-component system response regulator HydG